MSAVLRVILPLVLLAPLTLSRFPPPGSRQAIPFVTDEADAALAVVRARHEGRVPSDEEIARVFASRGYRALKHRQAAMGRPFTDSSFRAFLLSDTLAARWADLDRTLRSWRALDVASPARRALAYLPAGTPLRTTIYLTIKPQTNSFVFDLDSQRVIMLYVDPAKTRAELDNTVAHELHHIGITAACAAANDSGRPAAVARARNWMSAFGEGRAMLAAAGGPDVHPHAESDSATRARWDGDLSHFNRDIGDLERFFGRALDPAVPDDSITATGMTFFGVQGPWYTVGWKMAVMVEHAFGRPRLIATECDPPAFLRAYNTAAVDWNRAHGDSLAIWPDSLIGRLGGAPIPGGP